jgi:hypothetical protein
MSRSKDETAVTRRRFLGGLAAAAAAPSLIALGQADAATTKAKKKPAPTKPAGPAPAAAGPDMSVAHTPEERTALERQWKQTIETLATLRKVTVPTGSEIATGALAPLKLRRGEA